MMVRKSLVAPHFITAFVARTSTPTSSLLSQLKFCSKSTGNFRISDAASCNVVAGDGMIFTDPPPPKAADPSLLQPAVVVYDGVCHLCHQGVKWVIKTDKLKKIKFCCVQSRAAEPYLRVGGLDRQDVLRRFLFVEGLGLYYQGSTAALKVLSHLPFPYSALSALLIIPAPLRDAVYDYAAKRRYSWFGKEDECIVLQEKEILDRFIDRDEMLSKSS